MCDKLHFFIQNICVYQINVVILQRSMALISRYGIANVPEEVLKQFVQYRISQ